MRPMEKFKLLKKSKASKKQTSISRVVLVLSLQPKQISRKLMSINIFCLCI